MKTVFLIGVLAITVLRAERLEDCKCQEGFTPQLEDNGEVLCHGVVLKSILQCNLVFKPDCQCSSEATSVVQDSSGTWCGRFIEGVEDKRWECENTEDWDAFYLEHPEEKPKS